MTIQACPRTGGGQACMVGPQHLMKKNTAHHLSTETSPYYYHLSYLYRLVQRFLHCLLQNRLHFPSLPHFFPIQEVSGRNRPSATQDHAPHLGSSFGVDISFPVIRGNT